MLFAQPAQCPTELTNQDGQLWGAKTTWQSHPSNRNDALHRDRFGARVGQEKKRGEVTADHTPLG